MKRGLARLQVKRRALRKGKQRYRKSLRAPAYYSQLGRNFFRSYLKRLTDEVEEERTRLTGNLTKKGRPKLHSEVFLEEEPGFLALAALDHVFRTVGGSLADTEKGPWPSVQRVARAIAEEVERSRALRVLQATDLKERKIHGRPSRIAIGGAEPAPIKSPNRGWVCCARAPCST